MKKFKNFLNYFNLFELNLYQKSYKSPLIRIFGSLAVMLVVCAIRLSIKITNIPLTILVTAVMLGIMVLAIICFFIAAVECLQVGHNKKIQKERDKILNERSNKK